MSTINRWSSAWYHFKCRYKYVSRYMDTFSLFQWANKNLEKISIISKFVINLWKIMEKVKKNSENNPNNDWNWTINFKSRILSKKW